MCSPGQPKVLVTAAPGVLDGRDVVRPEDGDDRSGTARRRGSRRRGCRAPRRARAAGGRRRRPCRGPRRGGRGRRTVRARRGTARGCLRPAAASTGAHELVLLVSGLDVALGRLPDAHQQHDGEPATSERRDDVGQRHRDVVRRDELGDRRRSRPQTTAGNQVCRRPRFRSTMKTRTSGTNTARIGVWRPTIEPRSSAWLEAGDRRQCDDRRGERAERDRRGVRDQGDAGRLHRPEAESDQHDDW